jgi:microcystin-dependent protein
MAELESFKGSPPRVVEGDLWVTGKIYGTLQAGGAASGGSSDGGVPIGSVHYFAASTPPENYLVCDGSVLDAGLYSQLFNVTQYTFGGSGGSFNLPDLRGEFIRGWDGGKGTDSGRTFGSFQADEFKSHTHTELYNVNSSGQDQAGGGSGDNDNTSSRQSGAAGGAETRPRNVALLPCIRYQ